MLGPNNLRFPGQYYDQETGLHYNWHRDYYPAAGRYVESDPIGLESEELNPYVYVLNNPINAIDPLGLKKCGPCEEEYIDQEHFWLCLLGEFTGVELAGPSAQFAYRNRMWREHWRKVVKRMLPKVGKKVGPKLIPGIGWVLTGVDVARASAKCYDQAKRCRPKE